MFKCTQCDMVVAGSDVPKHRCGMTARAGDLVRVSDGVGSGVTGHFCQVLPGQCVFLRESSSNRDADPVAVADIHAITKAEQSALCHGRVVVSIVTSRHWSRSRSA